jgi:acetate---CoA ligase (ADP-forming) subunit alpha
VGKDAFERNLEILFNPETVAVVGASDNSGKLGYHVMKSLTRGGYKGRIIPVNPKAESIMGIPAFPSLGRFQDPLDLAIIVVPAGAVPNIFDECAARDVKGIVLITAGFKEIDDPSGGELQELLAASAAKAGIPVIGPNTFGMINLHKDLNASFTPEFSRVEKGSVTLVSQSGGISHLLAFMAMRQGIRLGKIVGLGNRLNVDFPQMLPYLMEDADTRAIALYLEGMDNPRPLLDAAEKFRGKKPIVALKTGSSGTGDLASLSHTGSMAGKHEVYQGAMTQAGILWADDTRDLLETAQALAVCPSPQGPGMAVLTGQAGPGMAACDVCERMGLKIAPFGPKTRDAVNRLLPPLAIRTNPVDMGPAWYDSAAIQGIVGAVMEDDNVDGLLILMMFASANREALPNLSDLLLKWNQKKPVVTCFISPPGIWDGEIRKLEEAGAIVNLPTPEDAARVMASLWKYGKIMGKRS